MTPREKLYAALAGFVFLLVVGYAVNARIEASRPYVTVPIFVSLPCTPNRFGTQAEAECAMYMMEQPLTMYPTRLPFFGDRQAIPVEQSRNDTGAWYASVKPGSYGIEIMPSSKYILLSATAGKINLARNDATYVVENGAAATPIRIAYGKSAAIDGTTVTKSQPVQARVFVENDAKLTSILSAVGAGRYFLDGFPSGRYRFCAIDAHDIERYKIDYFDRDTLHKWCRRSTDVILEEGKTVHLNIETSRAVNP